MNDSFGREPIKSNLGFGPEPTKSNLDFGREPFAVDSKYEGFSFKSKVYHSQKINGIKGAYAELAGNISSGILPLTKSNDINHSPNNREDFLNSVIPIGNYQDAHIVVDQEAICYIIDKLKDYISNSSIVIDSVMSSKEFNDKLLEIIDKIDITSLLDNRIKVGMYYYYAMYELSDLYVLKTFGSKWLVKKVKETNVGYEIAYASYYTNAGVKITDINADNVQAFTYYNIDDLVF